jgi:hypothetical protein
MQNHAEMNVSNAWCLPKRLVSHYSPFLKAACSRNFKERQENLIKLPDDDAKVFALFVEWMYYGSYAIAPPIFTGSTNVNAQCWVLGDKLLCTEFKNYAMTRLYTEYTATVFHKVVTTEDVCFACDNSNANSKLRELYVALVATNFSNPRRVHGAAEEWDSLIEEYADLRSVLLKSFKRDVGDQSVSQSVLKSKEYYLDDHPSLAQSLSGLRLNEHR